jgi:hypothetical protein
LFGIAESRYLTAVQIAGVGVEGDFELETGQITHTICLIEGAGSV